MAAEAGNHTSNCSELLRFMSHCAAMLGLPAPPPIAASSSSAGGSQQLLASARAFLQQVEAKRQTVESQLRDAKVLHRYEPGRGCQALDPTDCVGVFISRSIYCGIRSC